MSTASTAVLTDHATPPAVHGRGVPAPGDAPLPAPAPPAAKSIVLKLPEPLQHGRLVRPEPAAPPPRGPLARLRRSSPGVTQAGGRAAAAPWVLEFVPRSAQTVEPLMGWTAGSDPRRHVRLCFPDAASARRFAAAQGYRLEEEASPPRRRPKPRRPAGAMLAMLTGPLASQV